jgi:glycerol-3-phosphate dehydrogenase
VNRDAALARFDEQFEVLVIGGGATGLGAAVDAAARGYRTALIEAEDFAKATSSRSTKLVHGGVRYLRSGEIGLVREALHERTNLFNNAPHVVRDLPFVIPLYRWYEMPYYLAGLKLYDALAGGSNLPGCSALSASDALALVPRLNGRRLRGAVMYHDGQFDDARLAVSLARTAVDCGAVVANYVRAVRFLYENGRVRGVSAIEQESGRELEIRADAIVNATGIFVDELRALDGGVTTKLLTHSRGTHIVVPHEALGTSTHALMIPQTSDGRVIFATPWHEHIVIGTTDVKTTAVELDPRPTSQEVGYVLDTINPYLDRPLALADVVAVFAGLRPLVNRQASATAKLSREHLIDVSPSGLITIAGGKWTTYRKMAEDVVDLAAQRAGLSRVVSPTATLVLHGGSADMHPEDPFGIYGSDAAAVRALAQEDPDLAVRLHPRLPYIAAEVVYGARHEMARTVDDVLARRTRSLFLDSQAARECAPAVARLLAAELRRDAAWQSDQLQRFEQIAARTIPA